MSAFLAELEAVAARRKSTGFLCDLEVFKTDERGMLEIMRACGGAKGLPNLMASMGYPHSIEDNGKVCTAFTEYLIKRGQRVDWACAMSRVYFTSDEDAVMAQCLA